MPPNSCAAHLFPSYWLSFLFSLTLAFSFSLVRMNVYIFSFSLRVGQGEIYYERKKKVFFFLFLLYFPCVNADACFLSLDGRGKKIKFAFVHLIFLGGLCVVHIYSVFGASWGLFYFKFYSTCYFWKTAGFYHFWMTQEVNKVKIPHSIKRLQK